MIADAGRADDVGDLVPDWSATLALDAVLDDGARLLGGDPDRYGVPSLHAAVNWDRGGAFGRPGVTPNASDFIRLRDADGRPLPAGEIDSIRFARRADSVAWTTRDGALHSGDVPIADRSIAREVEVPRDDPALTFDTRYRTEAGFDFGFVQVSADGGASWRSLPSTHTTSVADSGALSGIARQLPGFTGDSGGWLTERIDLSQHAGERVLIAFRYLTDPFVNLEGWSIDNVAIGGALLSAGDDIDAWRTIADTQPGAMSVRLVAISDDEKVARIAELPLDHSGAGELSGAALQQQIGDSATTVAAIITNAEVTESYAAGPLWPYGYDGVRRYTLTVNDVVQAGG